MKGVRVMNTTRRKFREHLASPEIILAVGAFDALSAKIAEKLGFKAVVMGGYTTSASLLGKPDVGYLTLTEMAGHLAYITDACNIPVIADGDTGYGNPLNVIRTVHEYEKAGAAAILLEDQVAPKKCGHMEGKQVISAEEHVQKIKAALDARVDPDLVIIARTDARSVLGFDEAIRRGKMYREAGADMVFIEAPASMEELIRIPQEVDAYHVANMIEGGKTPFLPLDEVEKLGYKVAFYTLGVYYAAAKTVYDFMNNLKKTGTTANFADKMLTFSEFNELVGLTEVQNVGKKYGQ